MPQTRLGQSDVTALRATTTTLQRLAREHGGEVPGLAAVAEQGERLSRLPGKDAVRRQCLRVTVSAWTSAGWSRFDAGKNRAAWDAYGRAFEAAHDAGAVLLVVDVMRRAGVLAAERGSHDDALKLYDLALIRAMDAPRGPERLALESSLYGCRATSVAALGRRDLALSALAKAEDVELSAVESADLEWRRAETYTVLGDLDRAHEHASRSLESWPAGSRRDSVKAEVTIAGLHRRTGERDAEELLAGCWQRVEGTASVRARQRLMRAEGTLPA